MSVSGALSWSDAVDRHVGLVRQIVRDFNIHGADAEDLSQVGLLAMRDIAQRYDPSRHVEFSTFFRKCFVRILIKHRKSTNIVRVPSSTLDKKRHLDKNPYKFNEATRATCRAIERTLSSRRTHLDALIPDDADEQAVVDQADDIEQLRQAVLKIPVRPRMVLIGVLGLFGAEEQSLPEIARELDVTVDAAQDLFASSIRDLIILLPSDS